ncbi:aminotransferase class I/II-fold pyridoxal phosphate-dependent enzyme [Streptomyces sp. NPDC004126]|uniref:aminotransferase class I/II-fold pyridoxal phosphate-dependent enzyme n=1 Tax=Streptomyces sp. NPDC004126 TaxID=3390695 RepID=UPI003D040D20
MLDLTGPPRAWPERLGRGFAAAQERAARTPGCWDSAPSRGDEALRDRVAELAGLDSDGRERLVITGGIRQFAALWAGRTRVAVVEEPTFSDVPLVLGGASEVRRAPWERLADAAAGAGRVTFWLTSPLRNPDGRSLTQAERTRLAALAAAGHEVVVNQVYRWYAPTGCVTPDGAWSATSLSKLTGGGTRLGWAAGPSPEAAEAAAQSWRMPGPATVWQRTWALFLDRPTVAALLAECVEPVAAARRAFAARAAELLGWACDGEGLSLALAGTGLAEEALVARLAEAGVRANPGTAFGMPCPSVRLAFTGIGPADAVRAAERVAHLLARHPDLELTPWTATPSTPLEGRAA